MNSTKHKWDIDDNCKNCSLSRRPKSLSKNMMGYAGKFIYDYLVEGKWQQGAPECDKKNKTIKK